MLDELQDWWLTTTPETRTAVQTGSLILAALLCGHFLAAMVTRALRAWNLDAALRVPGSGRTAADPNGGLTPTRVAGILVRLTLWAGVAWWLAQKYGRVDLADTLVLVLRRTWTLAAVLVAALGLGSLLARRLI